MFQGKLDVDLEKILARTKKEKLIAEKNSDNFKKLQELVNFDNLMFELVFQWFVSKTFKVIFQTAKLCKQTVSLSVFDLSCFVVCHM